MKGVLAIVFLAISIQGYKAAVPRLTDRIVGGRNASMLEFPYQISLRRYNSHICGGSIFHSSFVLTAAHCVHGGMASQFSVRTGSRYCDRGGQVTKVCTIKVHEKFNTDTLDNDIALLELCTQLTFADRILPIALPEIGEDVAVGTPALTSGWGAEVEDGFIPLTLKQVEVPIVSQSYCHKVYKSYGGISSNMICAGFASGGKDACQGDSGGPLRANGKLMGIVSWGNGCARPQFPGVYTKVANYRNWIRKITNY